MKRKLINLSKKPFVRNIIIVLTGTAAAQIVTIGLSPIITRLYGPEAFGILGVFLAIIGIFSTVAALNYPIAIVLPKSDDEAKKLAIVSLYIAVIISLLSLIVLIFFEQYLIKLFELEEIGKFLYFLPVVIVLSGYLQVIQQWLIRTKQFKITAKTAVYNSIIVNVTKIGVGSYLPIASVLIIIQTCGIALRAGLMQTLSLHKMNLSKNQIKDIESLTEVAKKYKDFPLYRSPQVFINSFSQKLPLLLLTVYFGPVSAGFYLIGTQTLGAASELIGKSVQSVFYPRISEAANRNEDITKILIKSILGLFAIGIIPFSVVIYFGPELFTLAFGAEWTKAGVYAQWIAVMSFFNLITRTIVVTIPVLGMQKEFLYFEIVGTFLKVGSLAIGFYYFSNDTYAVALFSITSMILYIFLTIYTLLKSVKY